MIRAERLLELPHFTNLPPRALDALCRCGREVVFKPDEVLFVGGDDPRCWYVILEGSVRVVRGVGARQHVIHAEGPGGSLGEVPLFAGGVLPATAIAAEHTRCAVFARDSLFAVLREHAQVALLLLHRMAQRVRTLVDRVDDRSARTVSARLAAYILARQRSLRSSVVSLGMSQAALAEELGTVREVVVRELRSLQRRGLVSAAGRARFTVTDERALALVAAGEPPTTVRRHTVKR